MTSKSFSKIGHFKSVAAFGAHVRERGLNLPIKNDPTAGAMSQPIDIGGFVVGNRWCAHPMEGWDGTTTGEPTEHTQRRWRHFGQSGCKLIWGGEAFAVQADGRANPNQLGIVDGNIRRAENGVALLLGQLFAAHREAFGTIDDLFIGLQLTHSGRFCRPFDKRLVPKIAYHHPLLDAKFGIDPKDDSVVITDDYLQRLIDNYILAAKLAQRVGFQFVDVKACHGYLGHEMLSAFTRPGKFGGSFENRTRFMRQIIEGIRAQCPGLQIGVRFSAFDHPPFKPDASRGSKGKLGTGVPEEFKHLLPYRWGFGCDQNDPLRIDLSEPIALIKMLAAMDVKLINVSCCSPYYNPHFQRPAFFPPSDGYQPPEDPLIGVARQIDVVRQLKQACPASVFVGSGYTYLQEFLPNVSAGAVDQGWTDFVGVGRLLLSYWDLPADQLAGRAIRAKRLCRTFSDCTTAPRNGLISGCFPLDDHYKHSPIHDELKQKKETIRKSLNVIQAS